jgi:hypothetical protein
LLDLFDLTTIDLSEEVIDDFGDVDYILYRLQLELNTQFNTRKQIVLKTLYTYIAHNRTLEDSYGISMYGTNSFNLVWEDVCAEVLSNKLHISLGQLELPVHLLEGYRTIDKLVDIIEKPVWTGRKADGSLFDKAAKQTLIPDIINIWHQGNVYQFVIMDAKYYNIQLEDGKKLRGQPGVGDVTKQYLYQLAYNKFLDDHQINNIRNCFLMPTQLSEVVKIGVAKMDMLSSLRLQDIQIRQLPAKMMFNHYLSRSTMDMSLLEL